MTLVRTAEILAVGTELVTPHRLDTNSLYLTSKLNDIGIDVRVKGVVADDADSLRQCVRHALDRADLVVTSGGLGPTSDDLTREVVAEFLGLALMEDPAVLEAIRRRFTNRRLHMPEGNRRQAAVPAGALVLPNPNGTAPGLWIDVGQKILVLLPGPPRELQHIVEHEVLPRLSPRTGGRQVLRRVIKLTGKPESHVEEIAKPIYAAFANDPVPIDTTILASPGQIELHLSVRGSDIPSMHRSLDAGAAALAAALAPSVFSTDGRSLEEVVGALLVERRWRIAVAESCTGGLVSGRLTDVPGSSAWFTGGTVAYADEIKTSELGVPAALLAAHGAVSEPVARAMADSVLARFGADVGVGVTGIAGPGGGSPDKPVGTVVIAIAARTTTVRTFRFPGDRAMVRQQSVMAALDAVRQMLAAASAV